MLSNYIKITIRNLIKNKGQTLINIGGLTVGVLCAIVIFLTIQYEYGYDTWHEDRDRIYRVVRKSVDFGVESYDRGTHYPLSAAIEEQVTGIERVSIVDNNYANDPIVSVVDEAGNLKKLKMENLAFVEQDYLEIFSHDWISGVKDGALSQPNKTIITEGLSKKLFGTTNSIGKVIVQNNSMDLEVVGIIRDPQEQSDFPFEMLVSHDSKDREGGSRMQPDNWDGSSSSLQSYVKLLPGITEESINNQLEELVAKHREQTEDTKLTYYLQPLSDIHFNSEFGSYNRTIDESSLIALGVIGFFLLLTACINFINLNTAVAVKRSKEVGLRKTLGGTRSQLTLGFLGETGFITLLSMIVALALTEIVLINMNPVLGFIPELDLFNNSQVVLFLLSLLIFITLAAGWYPAKYLSGFSPIEAIRNKITASYSEGLGLRRGLIIVQFAVTQILIICTVIISSQIDYFQNQDLGFEKEAVVQIPLVSRTAERLNVFKSQVTAHSSIVNMAYSNTGTSNGNVWGGNYIQIEDTVRKEGNAQIKFIDVDFIDVYGLRLIAGTNITPSDTINKYIVNETYANEVGYEGRYNELLGKETQIWGTSANIVGVVEDFNTQSLHDGLEAVMLGARRNFFIAAVKIDMQRRQEALAVLEEAYNTAFPEFVFEYTFLDEAIANFYRGEERISNIMNGFTVIAILIGCLGLFGLVSYMATTRTKEIGVRKVLGANISDILRLFGKELLILLSISFVIAAPTAWYFMNKWLADFAYQIGIGLEIFLLSLVGTLVIALFTIAWKAMRAALANPVDSLKSE